MDDLGLLFEDLVAVVPGLSTFGSTRQEVLHATLMYIRGVQSAVGMTRSRHVPYEEGPLPARPYYSNNWAQHQPPPSGAALPRHQGPPTSLPPPMVPEQGGELNHTRWSDVTNAVTQKWSEQTRRDENTAHRVSSETSPVPPVTLKQAPTVMPHPDNPTHNGTPINTTVEPTTTTVVPPTTQPPPSLPPPLTSAGDHVTE